MNLVVHGHDTSAGRAQRQVLCVLERLSDELAEEDRDSPRFGLGQEPSDLLAELAPKEPWGLAMVQIQSGAYGLRTLSIGCCEVKRIATTLQENVSMRGRLEPAKELVAQTRLPGASRGRDDHDLWPATRRALEEGGFEHRQLLVAAYARSRPTQEGARRIEGGALFLEKKS